MKGLLSNPNPNAHEAKMLHEQFRVNIQRSFLSLLRAFSSGLKKDVGEETDFISSLDPNQIFSINFYYHYYSLLAMMGSQKLTESISLVEQILTNLNIDNVYKEIMSIGLPENATEKKFTLDILNKGQGGEMELLSEAENSKSKTAVEKALKIISDYDPEFFAEIHDHIHCIRYAKGNFSTFAGSSIKYFGGVFYAIPEPSVDLELYFFDLIGHESAHQHLSLLMAYDPIVLNDPTDRIYSAARDTLRPVKGTFHAHFVFYRLIRLYLKAKNHFLKNGISRKVEIPEGSLAVVPWNFEIRLASWIKRFYQGEAEIRKRAKLSEVGWALLENMSKEVGEMLK